MVNVRSVYTDSFRWRKSEGTRLLAQLIMGDFQAEKKVKALYVQFCFGFIVFFLFFFVNVLSDLR